MEHVKVTLYPQIVTHLEAGKSVEISSDSYRCIFRLKGNTIQRRQCGQRRWFNSRLSVESVATHGDHVKHCLL